MTRNVLGIRAETKNQWERRAPPAPGHVAQLIREHGVEVPVERAPLRVFPEEESIAAGARLLATGDPWGDRAMARTVGLPAAIAAHRVVSGKIPATGVQIPVLPEIVEPVLDELESQGYGFKESSLTIVTGSLDVVC